MATLQIEATARGRLILATQLSTLDSLGERKNPKASWIVAMAAAAMGTDGRRANRQSERGTT